MVSHMTHFFKKPYTKKEQEIYNLAYYRGINVGKRKGREEAIDDFEKWLSEHDRQVINDIVADLEQLKIENQRKNYKAEFALDIAIEIISGKLN